jgi:oxygen-independent coproporphyrinogen III oxidase
LAGIYIHIPFCRQACHYCNFHFTTSLRHKNELLAALIAEIQLRKDYPGYEKIETIYIGGGTPSLLAFEEIKKLLTTINECFEVVENAEISMEANPDDITEQKLIEWERSGISRLSIGVQSFFEEDLQWMNRAHDASQAAGSLQLAVKYFKNISVDLIYGFPLLTNKKWKENVDKAVSLNIPHLSCYALTVEPKTQLHKLIGQKKMTEINPERQSEQFLDLMKWLGEAGYEHYEISNFAKPGFRSRHNSAYWQGKKYIGIGPSAHSYDLVSRQWNIANNTVYRESIAKGIIPFEREELTVAQKQNEYIMTSLRTIEGIDLSRVGENEKFMLTVEKYLASGKMIMDKNLIKLTDEGKLLADGIAADLFF